MTPELIHEGKLDRQAAAEALRQFLDNMVRVSGLELNVNVRPVATDGESPGSGAEVLADFDGRDKGILLERGAEVLQAFEHLAFRALRLEPAFHEKIHIDCGGYRALRFEELFSPAVPAQSHVLARAPHRASGAEGHEWNTHRERWRGRRAPSGHSSRRRKTNQVESRGTIHRALRSIHRQ